MNVKQYLRSKRHATPISRTPSHVGPKGIPISHVGLRHSINNNVMYAVIGMPLHEMEFRNDLPCDLPCAASLAGIQPVRPRAQRTSP